MNYYKIVFLTFLLPTLSFAGNTQQLDRCPAAMDMSKDFVFVKVDDIGNNKFNLYSFPTYFNNYRWSLVAYSVVASVSSAAETWGNEALASGNLGLGTTVPVNDNDGNGDYCLYWIQIKDDDGYRHNYKAKAYFSS